jgi:hypothetical protein
MTVQTVVRTAPQQLRAVYMNAEDSSAINALLDAIGEKYSSTTQKGTAFAAQGGTRITISREGYPDQFAYPGDWLLVIDADFADGVWTVSADTEVQVWGVSTGLPGTAVDFTSKYTLEG